MGVIKPLFPAVNECVTMAEHGLWGCKCCLMVTTHSGMIRAQGPGRPLRYPCIDFSFPDLILKSVHHKSEPCSQVLQ